MQIGGVGIQPTINQTSQVSQPESAERGPEHDHDGDDGPRVSAASSLPAATGGRGAKVDTVA